MAEGSQTRFTAIVYVKTPDNIGPIRSAPLIDLEFPLMDDAEFAYSSSSIGVAQRMFSDEFSAPIIRPQEEGHYRTGDNRLYEPTLYAYPSGLCKALEAGGNIMGHT